MHRFDIKSDKPFYFTKSLTAHCIFEKLGFHFCDQSCLSGCPLTITPLAYMIGNALYNCLIDKTQSTNAQQICKKLRLGFWTRNCSENQFIYTYLWIDYKEKKKKISYFFSESSWLYQKNLTLTKSKIKAKKKRPNVLVRKNMVSRSNIRIIYKRIFPSRRELFKHLASWLAVFELNFTWYNLKPFAKC